MSLTDHSSSHLIFWPFLAIALLAIIAARRYSRLRGVPGPILATFTDLWAATKVWRGQYHHVFIRELHAKYGPVVRWGPNRVSFADSAAIPDILGARLPYQKSAIYDSMVPTANGRDLPTLITLRDEKRVSEIKRYVSAGFTQSAFLKQEAQIDEKLTILIDALSGFSESDIQIHKWLGFWSFDTMGQIAFSDSRNYLQHGRDIDNIFPAVVDRFQHWRTWQFMPTLERLLYRNPLVQRLRKSNSAIGALAMRRIQERKSHEKQDESAIGFDLMGRYLAASHKAPHLIAPNDILSLTVSTISAGSETVATASSLALCNMLRHPKTYKAVETELLDANLTFPPAFRDIDALKYLDAVILESLRYSVQDINLKERRTGPEPATICNYDLPGNVDISVTAACTSRDKSVFGPDVESFNPDRWLDADEAKRHEMERASLAFSYGRRVCIGHHLARIEMKKVLAALIMKFHINMVGKPETGCEKNVRLARLTVRLDPREKA